MSNPVTVFDFINRVTYADYSGVYTAEMAQYNCEGYVLNLIEKLEDDK
jgi:hypothetical protein